MAEAQDQGKDSSSPSMTMSMRMVIYGVKKAFPSVRNVTCEQLEQWRSEKRENLVCLVSGLGRLYEVAIGPAVSSYSVNSSTVR